MNRPAADYRIEERLCATLADPDRPIRIVGIDEVGRGAWAGPVTVCAAVTDLGSPPELRGKRGQPVRLTDSKLLAEEYRSAFAEILPGWLRCYRLASSAPEEVDELGMTEALRRAAVRALNALPDPPDAVILDGKYNYLGGNRGSRAAPGGWTEERPQQSEDATREGAIYQAREAPREARPSNAAAPWPVQCEIKADERSISVAAASVLAKVHRDALMAKLGVEYPDYGFANNAGYPSPVHKEALSRFGPTTHHRLSWSYMDDLPRWRHLRKYRDALAGDDGQTSLI